MHTEHINGIYYRNSRTEYSYGGECFQKIDKYAPARVRQAQLLVQGWTTYARGSFELKHTPRPLASNEWRACC